MIRSFLESKYGKYVTDQLVTKDNKVMLDNINKNGIEQQEEVIKHIASLQDKDGNKLIPERFLLNNAEWGMDFSSWIGTLNDKKEYLFIGAEPHISNNYQLVYDFGSHNEKTIEQDAVTQFNRESDIWHYLTKIFVKDLTSKNIASFLSKCYITDLSHIVPKGCGQVKDICKVLNISVNEWVNFRTSVAKNFLPAEIKAVNPRFVILHGNASRDYFRDILGVVYNTPYPIKNSPYKILTGEFNGYKIISIPHLKGDMRNKLWKCKKFPERPESAKEILNLLIS